ncbi:hypothetical protein CNYM01_02573 [Colletotrichum nymphaeae SA-01]|uniref:Uncharacterized protein n=1 Tax=Colletotrichum nymphaeae SA-01 TaxID=1460502 RepID=A0A135TIN1_9PEZI|nr:hypothetical protein CNYM01_02573 [Colletotrichum nymphaeae SA-01]
MALRTSKGIFAVNSVVSALFYDLSTNNRERHRCGDVGGLGIVAPEEGVSEATDKIRAEPTTSISKLNLWSQRVIASPSDLTVSWTKMNFQTADVHRAALDGTIIHTSCIGCPAQRPWLGTRLQNTSDDQPLGRREQR